MSEAKGKLSFSELFFDNNLDEEELLRLSNDVELWRDLSPNELISDSRDTHLINRIMYNISALTYPKLVERTNFQLDLSEEKYSNIPRD